MKAIGNSLRQRLSVWLSVAILSTGIVVTLVSFFVAYEDAREFQDHMLKQIALLATSGSGASTSPSTLISAPIAQVNLNPTKRTVRYAETRISLIRLPDDALPSWLAGNVKPGLHTLETESGRIRIFVLNETSGKTIVVAQPTTTRDELAMNSALLALIPLLLLMPILVWLVLRIIRRQLTPVTLLANHLDAQPADRPRPLSDQGLPDEIVPFVQAINRLLGRVNDLMSHQRRFIADAAHELRSPLTALSIQAQNLRQSATFDIMRERVLPMQAGIERARKLTEQLLNLARTQSEPLEFSEVDLSTMVRELIVELLPIAERKHIDLGLDEKVPISIPADPETLRLVLRNALENAVKYAPEGGEVTVRIYANETDHIVDIEDNGPGIAVAERKRVFDPFYRIPGAAGEGSGLGLSIAREAANSLGGRISLHDHPRGYGLVFRYQRSYPSSRQP